MKRRMFAILLSLAMVAGLMPENTQAEDITGEHQDHCVCCGTEEYGHQHDTSQKWTPISEINDSLSEGYYYLTQDVHTSSAWNPQDGVVLCLNGHSIICDSDTAVINLSRDKSLTLTDCSTAETGAITHEKGGNGRGICNKGGTLNLWRGSISGNQYHGTEDCGAGVYNSGNFYMYGGSVCNNTDTSSERTLSFGGGVYNAYGGEFFMENGSISGNSAINGGGGVYNNSGRFELSGGLISDNKSGGAGGGVANEDRTATFLMTGGTISGNETDRSGGGIVNYHSNFTMTGGSIRDNKASSFTYGEGGGIYNYNGTVSMQGGDISGNICAYRGGGVWNYAEAGADTKFTMSDGSICDNKVTSSNAFSGGGGVGNYAISYYDTEDNPSKVIFTMTGGTISGNSALNGGGIWGLNLDNSEKGYEPEVNCILSGGSISHNTATQSGGGIFDSYGTVKMENGSISGNIAGSVGGGIYNDSHALVMSGGLISGNRAQKGGGVANYGTFEMSGNAAIADNEAQEGGGVYDCGYALTLSGSPSITANREGNLCLNSNKKISAAGLTSGAQIGVTANSTEFPITITQDAVTGNYFTADNSEYKIVLDSEGHVVLQDRVASVKEEQPAPEGLTGVAPVSEDGNGYISGTTADMQWREKGTETWYDCVADQPAAAGKTYEIRYKETDTKQASPVTEVSIKQKGRLTIDSANMNKTYDGNPVSAPMIKETTNEDGADRVKYEYKLYGEADNAYTTTAPKNAGKYTVRVTIDEDDNHTESAASADFTISRKPVDIIWYGSNFTFNGKEQKPEAAVVKDDICDGDMIKVKVVVKDYEINGGTNPGIDPGTYMAEAQIDDDNYTIKESAKKTVIYTIQAKEPEVPEHIYSEPVYTWNTDYSECTAVRTCTVCGNSESETARAVSVITQEQSCTLPELTKYTATFDNAQGTDFETQVKDNIQTASAAGHKWDGGIQSKAPTYTEEGEMLYTCSVCGTTRTEAVEKLEPDEYDILEGKNTTYVIKADNTCAIRVNCEVRYFEKVMVDGKVVDPKYYTVKSGSTIVTFVKEFMDSLSTGSHEVKFLFTNGIARATITTVQKQDEENKPDHSDKPATQQKPGENTTPSTGKDTQQTPAQQISIPVQQTLVPAQQTATPSQQTVTSAQQQKSAETDDNNQAVFYLVLCGIGIAAVEVTVKRRKHA